jgi:hypothetical protein
MRRLEIFTRAKRARHARGPSRPTGHAIIFAHRLAGDLVAVECVPRADCKIVPLETHWLAGLRGLELRNVAAKYLFETYTDFRRFGPIWAPETIRARAAKSDIRTFTSRRRLGECSGGALNCNCVQLHAGPSVARRTRDQALHHGEWSTGLADVIELARERRALIVVLSWRACHPAVPFMGPPGPLRLRLLGPLTPCRLLRSGYLITGSASWLPAHGAFAGTWRTRRACQCAPCIGSPQSAHGRAGCGGRHVDDVIMIAAKIASRIECS